MSGDRRLLRSDGGGPVRQPRAAASLLVTALGRSPCTCAGSSTADLSLPKIGALFGGRDHTTVMHADRKIRALMAERRSIYNQVTELSQPHQGRLTRASRASPGPRHGRRGGRHQSHARGRSGRGSRRRPSACHGGRRPGAARTRARSPLFRLLRSAWRPLSTDSGTDLPSTGWGLPELSGSCPQAGLLRQAIRPGQTRLWNSLDEGSPQAVDERADPQGVPEVVHRLPTGARPVVPSRRPLLHTRCPLFGNGRHPAHRPE
ncbi:Chromosomal replication initiator protein DnaA [Streptomyces tanashiensis]